MTCKPSCCSSLKISTGRGIFRLFAHVKSDLLAQFPQLGRVVPEENDETIREIIVRPYRIIYKVLAEKEIVAIARVGHGARGEPDIPSQLNF